MTELDRTHIDVAAFALGRVADSLAVECTQGKHIDIATTEGHIEQLRIAVRLLNLIAKGEPCEQK